MKQHKSAFLPKLLALTGAFIVFFGVYEALCRMQCKWIVYLYAGLLTAALLAWMILNGGFGRKVPTEDLLPERWSAEKKAAYLAGYPRRKRICDALLIVIIPLLFTFFIDFMYLRFFAGI